METKHTSFPRQIQVIISRIRNIPETSLSVFEKIICLSKRATSSSVAGFSVQNILQRKWSDPNNRSR